MHCECHENLIDSLMYKSKIYFTSLGFRIDMLQCHCIIIFLGLEVIDKLM